MRARTSESTRNGLEVTIDEFTLDTLFEGDVLKATMNRYRPRPNTREQIDGGYVLLLAHGMGFHKEHWEPTLYRLFDLDEGNPGSCRILEAWALDYPNHGEAAELNETVLRRRNEPYTNAFSALYKSGLLGNIQDQKRKIVLIGHSAGTIAVTLMTTLFDDPRQQFDKVILVEPTMWDADVSSRMSDMYHMGAKTTALRRNRWASKEAAYDWFRTRPPWSNWDPTVLKLFAEYGLRESNAESEDKQGVVLQCDPVHEAHCFVEAPPTVYKLMGQLGRLCGLVPFHIIFGERDDMFSRKAKDSIINKDKGRVFASVTRIKGAGHLIVQERPAQLADVLHMILHNHGGSKL
ncbi:alpha/beta-hydrolase [Agrocybe pediades]|nr:alpha/beta-hydrolase [Agrocybe pediades]